MHGGEGNSLSPVEALEQESLTLFHNQLRKTVGFKNSGRAVILALNTSEYKNSTCSYLKANQQ